MAAITPLLKHWSYHSLILSQGTALKLWSSIHLYRAWKVKLNILLASYLYCNIEEMVLLYGGLLTFSTFFVLVTRWDEIDGLVQDCSNSIVPWSYCSLALSHWNMIEVWLMVQCRSDITVVYKYIFFSLIHWKDPNVEGIMWTQYSSVLFNSSPLSAAYMHQWITSALVQIIACRLFGAKPLSEPMLEYY